MFNEGIIDKNQATAVEFPMVRWETYLTWLAWMRMPLLITICPVGVVESVPVNLDLDPDWQRLVEQSIKVLGGKLFSSVEFEHN